MIKKTKIRGSKMISVTFATFEHSEANELSLVGEFNDWSPETHPMRRRKDGAWAATVRLQKGSEHQYRFLVDGADWASDPEADELVENPYGGKNSVVSV